jgi:hypothetical protein
MNQEIKGPARAVLIVMADRAAEDGTCWPSIATLAKECGFSRSTVKNSLRVLKSAGLLSWNQRTESSGDLTSNLYRLTLGRAGDDPPRSGDGSGVGQEPTEGRAGAGHKASSEAPIESISEASLFGEEELPSPETTPSKNGHELFDHWKSFEELPQIREVTPKRKTQLKARLKEPFFRENWKTAISKIASTPFTTGAGPRGWKADIDWLLAPGNLVKIVEGKYDATTTKPTTKTVETGGRTSDNSESV